LHNLYNTLFIGKVLVSLEAVASTNTYALEQLQHTHLHEGTVISTQTQYAGRGQRGNRWESNAGKNITLSIVLYPNFLRVQQQFLLSQTIALGIHQFCSDILQPHQSLLRIKWPNDIYYGTKKIAGILIENTLRGQCLASSVVGIGINVNQQHFKNLVNASSLSNIAKTTFLLPLLIQKLCYHIETQYLQLKAAKVTQIQQKYLSILYRYQSWHYYHSQKHGKLYGKITGISPYGHLQIQTATQEYHFDVKEVAFL